MNPFRIMYAIATLLWISIRYRKDIYEECLCENNIVQGE